MTGIWNDMLKIVIRGYAALVRYTFTAGPSMRQLHAPRAATEIDNVTEPPLATRR